MSDKDDAAFLRALGMAGRDGRLTRAAALLFGEPGLVVSLKPAGIVDYRRSEEPWAGDIPAGRWRDRELCESNLLQSFLSLYERLDGP